MASRRFFNFPNLYDLFMFPFEWAGNRRRRHELVRQATGRVLEIGVGTGLNLPFYSRATGVVGIDPQESMLRRAGRRAERAPFPVQLIEASAESLPFAAAEFDTVVVTLSLCTIPDDAAALAEMRRVLVSGGRLYFLEHVRPRRNFLARTFDRLTPGWKRIAGGCHLNRDTVANIAAAGFVVEYTNAGTGGVFVDGVARNP
jgi:ubiquinone/menaquinone biosynthesis C-methylase UbiE